jgi:murein DD-endopeptidase MepM/ murein hydrolase activator NlpD
VVDFRDSVLAYKKKQKVKYVEREASGIIESSLSEAILKQGIDYNVTNSLSEIYAWTIDFFRLQKGDRFKVIYKEKYINDTIYAGAGSIEAAYFEHNGEPFYAFNFVADSTKNINDYYDDQAKNLRRTFLQSPVQFSRISSRYNLNRRIAYYGYKVRPHKGTDYAAPIGTPILATANGTVTESTRRGGNGKYVKIQHNGTYSTQYLHMKNQKVKKGDFVKQGDVIGWIGMTGNTGGPHVCYRFWKNGRQVDPLKEKLPAAEPIADSLKTDYLEFVGPKKSQLDCIEYIELPEEDLLTLNE